MNEEKSEKLKPVGFNLTISTKEQLYRIAAFLRTKRTNAVIKLFELLFSELINDKKFKAFLDAYNRIERTMEDKSSYTSFYISQEYLQKFEDIMFDLGFSDRSPFLRLIIDYVYNHKVKPLDDNVIPEVKNELEGLGYKIENIVPILDGKIIVLIDNPAKKPGIRKTKTKKTE
jgi:hypothetical protein